MDRSFKKGLGDYKIVTITHKTTSIRQLKDYLVGVEGEETDYPASKLRKLKQAMGMDELLYLNTCNRVAFFFTSSARVDQAYLSELFGMINPSLRARQMDKHISVTSVYEGRAALEHFFSVAASLDSLIVGEREILGQIRLAYDHSRAAELSGDSIRLAVERAVVFAKRIYHETRIGEKPVSVVSLAFRQLLEHIPGKDSPILMIGAGQTNIQLLNFMKKHGMTNVHIFNRTLRNAEELAERLKGARAYPLSELSGFEIPFEVVISCTGSREPVLSLETFEGMNTVGERDYTMLDLAVPHDIDPAILMRYKVQYVDVASLEEVARINMSFRRREVVKAENILEAFVNDYEDTFRQRQLELALTEIPDKVKALRSRAMEEVFADRIAGLDDDSRKVLEEVVHYFEKKYIGIPMKIAKKTLLGLENFRD